MSLLDPECFDMAVNSLETGNLSPARWGRLSLHANASNYPTGELVPTAWIAAGQSISRLVFRCARNSRIPSFSADLSALQMLHGAPTAIESFCIKHYEERRQNLRDLDKKKCTQLFLQERLKTCSCAAPLLRETIISFRRGSDVSSIVRAGVDKPWTDLPTQQFLSHCYV